MKRQKRQDQGQSQQDSSSNAASQKKTITKKYRCLCGKRYKNPLAGYTHINNEHKTKLRESKILLSIRQKYLASQCNQKSWAECPEVRTKALQTYIQEIQQSNASSKKDQKLYNLIDQTNYQIRQLIVDIHNRISRQQNKMVEIFKFKDEEEEFDQCQNGQSFNFESKMPFKKAANINQKVGRLKELYKLTQIEQITPQSIELQPFQFSTEKRHIVQSLISYFKAQFAAYLQLEIEILVTELKGNKKHLYNQIRNFERQIWKNEIKIKQKLEQYIAKWLQITSDS